MSRTASITETLLGKNTNIRNNAELRQAASEGVTVRPVFQNDFGMFRSNVSPDGAVRVTQNPNTPLQEEPVLQDIVSTPQQAGFSWLLPLVVIGGIYAAFKLKKKKKNVSKV